MSVDETVKALLRKNRNHEKSAQPGVNNHVPMVLIALYRLGATAEVMNRYVETFDLTELHPRPLSTNLITRANWQTLLGQGSFSNWVDFLRNG